MLLSSPYSNKSTPITSGFQFNVSMYSEESVQKAYHQYELTEDEDLNVYMDVAHMGVGGHDSWSPSVEKEFIVEPGRFRWSMYILPLKKDDDAGTIALQKWRQNCI